MYSNIYFLFFRKIINVFKLIFFLEKLLMYSKLILEIEISVLKANGIKHKEYSLYIVFGL